MSAVNASIQLRDVTIGYDHRPALRHVSGSFVSGSMTAIVGPNGAGKTTLLKAIAGVLQPSQGEVDLGALRRSDIAYLPQQSEIDRSFPISVMETVLLGHWRRVGPFRAITGRLREQAAKALGIVGLDGYATRAIGELSVGQFQRVLFARMLLQDGAVIVLDEPFAAVDARTTADLLGVVQRWHGEGRTVIAVLHDLEQVRAYFPRTLLLACDLVAWDETDRVLQPKQLARARALAETGAGLSGNNGLCSA